MADWYVLVENGVPINVARPSKEEAVREWESAEPDRQATLVPEAT